MAEPKAAHARATSVVAAEGMMEREASFLLSLSMGMGFEQLLSVGEGDAARAGRARTEGQLPEVGFGRRSRLNLAHHWEVAKSYSTPDVAFDSQWQKLKAPRPVGVPSAHGAQVEPAACQQPADTRTSNGEGSFEIDVRSVRRLLCDKLGQGDSLLETRERKGDSAHAAFKAEGDYTPISSPATPSAMDSISSCDEDSGSATPVLTIKSERGQNCVWHAKVSIKDAYSTEWESVWVWLDCEGHLSRQSPNDDEGEQLFDEGTRYQARQLRYPEECSKPHVVLLTPDDATDDWNSIRIAMQASELSAFLRHVARLQRRRRLREALGELRAAAALFGVFALMVGLSVVNKVLFRMVLVAVGTYVHALSCSTNLVYLLYSWCGVLMKMVFGSKAQRSEFRWMLAFARDNWALFASIGVCESMAFTLLPIASPKLPKAIVPVVSQSLLPISMLLNAILLGRRHSLVQVSGVMITMLGIFISTAGDGDRGWDVAGLSLGEFTVPFLLTVLAYSLLALSFIFKDVAFSKSLCAGHSLDLFLVEGVAAIGQCAALALQWPMNFALLTDLSPWHYFQQVRGAFLSAGALMPGLLVLYWVGNILYRLATLRAVRQLSSVSTMLANLLTVPLSSLVFCLPIGLPLLGQPETFSLRLMAGLLLLCVGLVLFNWVFVWGACKKLVPTLHKGR